VANFINPVLPQPFTRHQLRASCKCQRAASCTHDEAGSHDATLPLSSTWAGSSVQYTLGLSVSTNVTDWVHVWLCGQVWWRLWM